MPAAAAFGLLAWAASMAVVAMTAADGLLVEASVPADADAPSLRELAANLGIFFGAAANAHELDGSAPDCAPYSSLLAAQYSLVTAENSCKWAATEPLKGQFNFSSCDAVLNWTRQEHVNQTFRGHNLCWGSNNPDWLLPLSGDELRAALKAHIDTVVPHYGEAVYGWDVVNEALDEGKHPLFKNNAWYPAVPDYVDFAFTTARAAGGDEVKLFYNDYNVASSLGFSQAKSDKMFNMVKDMKARGIPIDGVGLQLHVAVDYDLVAGVSSNIARYHDIGIEVHMTEVDVACVAKPGSDPKVCQSWTSVDEQKQAEVYAALLDACLSSPACKNFETWGFTDAHTWRKGLHPLPFDEKYTEKPAVQALRDTLQKALVSVV